MLPHRFHDLQELHQASMMQTKKPDVDLNFTSPGGMEGTRHIQNEDRENADDNSALCSLQETS